MGGVNVTSHIVKSMSRLLVDPTAGRALVYYFCGGQEVLKPLLEPHLIILNTMLCLTVIPCRLHPSKVIVIVSFRLTKSYMHADIDQ